MKGHLLAPNVTSFLNSTTYNLKKYERMHAGETLFARSKCDKLFSQMGNLEKNEITYTREQPFARSKYDKSIAQMLI